MGELRREGGRVLALNDAWLLTPGEGFVAPCRQGQGVGRGGGRWEMRLERPAEKSDHEGFD